MSCFKVNILGDFVDSYIYSGYLFVVDSNYKLSVYKWSDLVGDSLLGVDSKDKKSIERITNDSREKISLNVTKNITIKQETLAKHLTDSYEIGVWPTDINIFSNNLYISSELGVTHLKFEYSNGTLSKATKMFDEMVFTLSPNSFGRFAIAAGKSGVLSYTPFSRYFNRDHIKPIIESTCIDLDWQSTTLFAEVNDAIVRCDFSPMPENSDDLTRDDYFYLVNRVKQEKPKTNYLDSLSYAWVAGNKVYAIGKNGSIYTGFTNNSELIEHNIGSLDANIERARTAAFGTIIEKDNKLLILSKGAIKKHADGFVSWRVFPRAKNYANQLHIIRDEYIELDFIESNENDLFSLETDEIDLKG
ncbi:hypothetical protein [Vibrio sp. Hal054]|uniref:hypothetical protein n=1 Tax=Vibrio sp. Hal054 TaxID=3035158 RepID=UPI00301DC357